MKKMLCILLCLMMAPMLPASGESTKLVIPERSGDYHYTLDSSNVATIVEYFGQEESLTVPSSIEGYPVKTIGYHAFENGYNLTTVTLPDSVEIIDSDSFGVCESLAEILVAPDNPVFTQIDGVLFNKTDKTLIAYPVKKKGKSYSVPAEIKSIGKHAFLRCDNLTSITLPEGLETISDYAFDNCRKLTKVTLPNSIETIGSNPFANCESLSKISVAPNNPVFTQIDGVLFNIVEEKLIAYPIGRKSKTYTVPAGIKSIGDDAFFGSEKLTSIMLPEELESIGDWAFSLCENLTSIMLPERLEYIGDDVFDEGIILTVVSDSYAETWAMENGIDYQYPD